LVYLSQQLGLAESASGETANIVVLRADERQFGLVVDEINDTEEIVVKPLNQQLKGIGCFAGATIMGDGQVALILDVLGIAQGARVVNEIRDRAIADTLAQTTDTVAGRDAWLVFTVGEGRRMAIPLAIVARLEEFDQERVERSGDRLVVQYRNAIMPLIDIANLFNDGAATPARDKLQVVVYSVGGQSVGLIVDQIVDVVEQAVVVEHRDQSPMLLGSAVIQERVTDLLNLESLAKVLPTREARL
jgi:two-component system, chemotaxis family, sensor kinase CheA